MAATTTTSVWHSRLGDACQKEGLIESFQKTWEPLAIRRDSNILEAILDLQQGWAFGFKKRTVSMKDCWSIIDIYEEAHNSSSLSEMPICEIMLRVERFQ